MDEFEKRPQDIGVEILSYVEAYADNFGEPFKDLLKPLVAAGARLGISTGANVAEQVNAFSVFRVYLDVLPPSIQGPEVLRWELYTSALESIVNTARDGRLLYAVTGRQVQPDIPPWLSAYLLREGYIPGEERPVKEYEEEGEE